MLDYHLKELLEYLMQEDYTTAEEMSEKLHISEKTVRNRLKELRCVLTKSGSGELLSRPRCGYRLEIKSESRFRELCSEEDEGKIPSTVEERNRFLLAYLMQQRDFVKMEDLADFLYVSKNTLGQNFKMVENIFIRYGIKVVRKPNYGIKIEGNEADIRHLQVDYFVKRDGFRSGYKKMQTEIEALSRIVWELLLKYELHLSEIAYESLIDYIYISIKRIKQGFCVQMDLVGSPEVGIKEQVFIKELVQVLQSRYQITIGDGDVKYLLLYIAGRKVTENLNGMDTNFVIKEQIDALAMEMIVQVKKHYNIHFANVFDLRMTLNQHLVPFDIRMKYSIPIKNPLLEEIKKEYSLAYEMAYHAASVVVYPYYQKYISEDEIGYFALLFALALEKEKKSEIPHSNILLICASGSSTSRLLEYKYRSIFKDYIKQVYICDLVGLYQFDFSKVDYAFTTIPISVKIPVPIFEVGLFLSEEDIKVVGGVLKNKGQSRMKEYYQEHRFLADFTARDKLEAIAKLCSIIGENEVVDQEFYELVLERESYAQMDYGNGIAIPHPNRLASEHTFAYVAVLREPILWNYQKVQVILLTSVGRQPDENRHLFYEMTARFALNPEKIQELIKDSRFEKLLELLEQ